MDPSSIRMMIIDGRPQMVVQTSPNAAPRPLNPGEMLRMLSGMGGLGGLSGLGGPSPLGNESPNPRARRPETPAPDEAENCANCVHCRAQRIKVLKSLLVQQKYAQHGFRISKEKAVEILEGGSFMGGIEQCNGATFDIEREAALAPFRARTAEAAELFLPASKPWCRPAIMILELSAAMLMASGSIRKIRKCGVLPGTDAPAPKCPSQFAFLMGENGPVHRDMGLVEPHMVTLVNDEGKTAMAALHGSPAFSLSCASRNNPRRLNGKAVYESRAVDMCSMDSLVPDLQTGSGRSPPTARLAKSGPAALQMALPAVRYMRSLLRVCVSNYFSGAQPKGWDPRDTAEVRSSLRRLSDISSASGLPRMAQIMVQNAIGIVASCEVMPLGLKEEKAAVEWKAGTPQVDWSAASVKAREGAGGSAALDEANRARLLDAWSHVAAGLAPELNASWHCIDQILASTKDFELRAAASSASASASAAKQLSLEEAELEVGLALALLAALPTLALATSLVLHGSDLNTDAERAAALRRAGFSDALVQHLSQRLSLDRYTQAISWASAVMSRYAKEKKLGSTDPPAMEFDHHGIPYDCQPATTPGNIAWLITDAFGALPRLTGGLDSIRMLRGELRDAGSDGGAAAAAAAASSSGPAGPSSGSLSPSKFKPAGTVRALNVIRASLEAGRGFEGFGRSGRIPLASQCDTVAELLVAAIESGALGPWDAVEEQPQAFVSVVRNVESGTDGRAGLGTLFSLVLSHPRARARLIQVLRAERPTPGTSAARRGAKTLLETALDYFVRWRKAGNDGGPQDHLAPYMVQVLGPATAEGASQPARWQPIESVGQGRDYLKAVFRVYVHSSLDSRTVVRSVPLTAAGCVLRAAQGLFLKATRRPAKGGLTAEGVRAVSDAVGLVSDSAPLVHLAADLAGTYGRAEGTAAGAAAAPRFGSDMVRYGVGDFLVAYGEFLLSLREVCAEQELIAVRARKAARAAASGPAKGGAKKGKAPAPAPEAPVVISLEVWKEKNASRLSMLGPAAMWADTVEDLGRAWAAVRGAQRRALVAATAATATGS